MTDTIVMKCDWGDGNEMVWYVDKNGVCYRISKHLKKTKKEVKEFFKFETKSLLNGHDQNHFYFNPVAYRRIKS